MSLPGRSLFCLSGSDRICPAAHSTLQFSVTQMMKLTILSEIMNIFERYHSILDEFFTPVLTGIFFH